MGFQAMARGTLTVTPSATVGDITEITVTLDVSTTHSFSLTGNEIITMTVDASDGGDNDAGKFTPSPVHITGTNMGGGISVGASTFTGNAVTPEFTGEESQVTFQGGAPAFSSSDGNIFAPSDPPLLPSVTVASGGIGEITPSGTNSTPSVTGSATNVTQDGTGTDASSQAQNSVAVWYERDGDDLNINAGYWKTNSGTGTDIRINYTILR